MNLPGNLEERKKILSQFTMDELTDALEGKQEPGEWWSEDYFLDDDEKDRPWWYRRYHSYSSITQQVVPEDDGSWKCASHYAHPSGSFATAEDAMAAYDEIIDQYTTHETKPDYETNMSWDWHYSVEYNNYKAVVSRGWAGTWSYIIYKNVAGSQVLVHESPFCFEHDSSARDHAEKFMYDIESSNPKEMYKDPIAYQNPKEKPVV